MMNDERLAGGHRYAQADAELSGFFTSALGVRAQGYEGTGGAFDPASLHDVRVRELEAGAMAWFERVRATLERLPRYSQARLALIYTPRSWPATWMASALASPWGGGSMASFALSIADHPEELRRWLLDDVARPVEHERRRRETICRKLVDACEPMRMSALEAYDALRVTRLKAEGTERRAKRSAGSARNQELYANLLAGRDAREADRFALRMGRAA